MWLRPVRRHLLAAALSTPTCAPPTPTASRSSAPPCTATRRDGAPDRRGRGLARLRRPDRGRRPARGRDRPGPRLRRRRRRAHQRPARRPDRPRDRPGHDRRDARARPRERRRGGRANVEFLKGHIEDIPLPDELGRRRHLQLRHQPLRRQAAGPARGRARPQAGRPLRRLRRDRRPRHGRGDPHRHGSSGPAASRARSPSTSSPTPSPPPASPTSRSARPTASTRTRRRRSSARASRYRTDEELSLQSNRPDRRGSTRGGCPCCARRRVGTYGGTSRRSEATRTCPIFVRGEGCYVWDVDGRSPPRRAVLALLRQRRPWPGRARRGGGRARRASSRTRRPGTPPIRARSSWPSGSLTAGAR